jgi:DNA-binding MarR family transcriptional regulator
VSRKTLAELKQKRPFASAAVEAYVNVLRTADRLLRGVEPVLQAAGLTATQYNVLRILRGAGPEGLACREIGARMITRDPDITRLLDRLEKRGLVTRAREKQDRRVITARISPAGLRILKSLDQPVLELHERQLRRLGPRRTRLLIRLLEQLRESTE